VSTSSEEQYLKIIYSLSIEQSRELVPMREIGLRMSVSSGTVTSMIKNLDRQNFVKYVPQKGCSLTKAGRTVAITLLRRHRLIEEFLFKILGYSRYSIHDEAETLEHVVSNYFIDRIDEMLNYPLRDPHGDPIPNKSGEISEQIGVPLPTMEIGVKGVIQRLHQIDCSVMKYLEEHAVVPGSNIVVASKDAAVEIITLSVDDRNAVSLSFNIAKNIHVLLEEK